MSSNPGVLLIASIKPINGDLDGTLEKLLENFPDREFKLDEKWLPIVPYEDTDLGIYPDEGSFCTYTYLSYGWGETTTLEECDKLISAFKILVEELCKITNSIYSLSIGANFY